MLISIARLLTNRALRWALRRGQRHSTHSDDSMPPAHDCSCTFGRVAKLVGSRLGRRSVLKTLLLTTALIIMMTFSIVRLPLTPQLRKLLSDPSSYSTAVVPCLWCAIALWWPAIGVCGQNYAKVRPIARLLQDIHPISYGRAFMN